MRYLGLFLMLAGLVSGQTPTASVVGRVVDASGAVIPGVSVKVVQLETNQAFARVTDAAGDFTVPYLTPGKYIMEAKGAGFRAHKQAEFVLTVNQTLRFDIQMEVGATSESVTVTDTPTPLTTESGARGDVTTNQELTEMPLAGRNFSDLAYLTEGVLPKGEDQTS